MKTLKTLLFILLLSFTFSVSAQKTARYKIVDNEIVKVETKESKVQPKKTVFIRKIKGKTYDVYRTSRGSLFIWRTSKKTQNRYKQYLKI